MAMKPPKERDDRKDLTRTDSDREGSHTTPGLDPAAKSARGASAPEGGLGATGEGSSVRKTPHKKIATNRRDGDTTGEGNWSGRDEMRGPRDTSTGARGAGGSANQVMGNPPDDKQR